MKYWAEIQNPSIMHKKGRILEPNPIHDSFNECKHTKHVAFLLVLMGIAQHQIET